MDYITKQDYVVFLLYFWDVLISFVFLLSSCLIYLWVRKGFKLLTPVFRSGNNALELYMNIDYKCTTKTHGDCTLDKFITSWSLKFYYNIMYSSVVDLQLLICWCCLQYLLPWKRENTFTPIFSKVLDKMSWTIRIKEKRNMAIGQYVSECVIIFTQLLVILFH